MTSFLWDFMIFMFNLREKLTSWELNGTDKWVELAGIEMLWWEKIKDYPRETWQVITGQHSLNAKLMIIGFGSQDFSYGMPFEMMYLK